jgi:hypothetical protein
VRRRVIGLAAQLDLGRRTSRGPNPLLHHDERAHMIRMVNTTRVSRAPSTLAERLFQDHHSTLGSSERVETARARQ